MGRAWMVALGCAVVGFCLALGGSCNSTDEGPRCGVGDCPGCCLADGCVAGDIPEACGGGGQACLVCGLGQACVAGACVAGPVCGNATLESGEECDDGNTADGDGCDASCHTESPGADADADAADVPEEAEAWECGAYPHGPYRFQAVGDTLAPMRWSAARSGIDEELAADVQAIRCAPGVHSLFLMVASTTCSVCPGRLREIAGLKSTWETNGAKWVFLVTDAGSPPMASGYIDRYGLTFGWRSNDMDNSEGAYAIAEATAVVPWIAVVRTSDMQVRYLESGGVSLDIANCARTLAAE
jgi:cysteine-rich repeat protein